MLRKLIITSIMLSLLSLLLASGTVLRADTDEWTPSTYPNPRKNATLCNTRENSTLCDPDHILTDFWRTKINDNIDKQMERLKEANIQYTEKAPEICDNSTIQIYVLLAKRIKTSNNQSITEQNLTSFGNELTQKYGLDQQPCKNFILLIGIEAAKLAYVRTGRDLKLPADLMQKVFHEYNLFNAKNYMEGLNKIVDEIGEKMWNPFKDTQDLIAEIAESTTTQPPTSQSTSLIEDILSQNGTQDTTNVTMTEQNMQSTPSHIKTPAPSIEQTPWWIILLLGSVILSAMFSLIILWASYSKRRQILAHTKAIVVAHSTINNNNHKNSNIPTKQHSISVGKEDTCKEKASNYTKILNSSKCFVITSEREPESRGDKNSVISTYFSETPSNETESTSNTSTQLPSENLYRKSYTIDEMELSPQSQGKYVHAGVIQRPTTPTKTATTIRMRDDNGKATVNDID